MSLKTQWHALSPKVQRWAMFAVAGGGLFALAALSVSTVKPLEPAATPQERLVRNLLTDTDPRTMGVEGLATRLARMEKHVDKECFVIVGGFGDLGSERAYLRSETLTCVRTDGGVIEVPIDGYAVGEDGKVGVRGRLVSKQGAMLANAMQAGFLQSFAKVFTQVPTIPLSAAGAGSQMQFQSMFSPQAAESAVAGGVGGAMEKLADFYMKMADQTFPVLEVDAGRAVELILNKGVSLRLSRDAPG